MSLINFFRSKTVANPALQTGVGNSVPKPDFVQEYVIADPKHVLIDYNTFALCGNIPVALERKAGEGGWLACKDFPADILEYLNLLKKQPDAFRAQPLARTITEYKLGGKSLYIVPCLYIIAEEDHFLFMNRTIRKHMADTIRRYKTL